MSDKVWSLPGLGGLDVPAGPLKLSLNTLPPKPKRHPCQCNRFGPESPCPNDMTQEDLLCDTCRESEHCMMGPANEEYCLSDPPCAGRYKTICQLMTIQGVQMHVKKTIGGWQ